MPWEISDQFAFVDVLTGFSAVKAALESHEKKPNDVAAHDEWTTENGLLAATVKVK